MEIIGQVGSGHMIDEMSELQSLAMPIFMLTQRATVLHIAWLDWLAQITPLMI